MEILVILQVIPILLKKNKHYNVKFVGSRIGHFFRAIDWLEDFILFFSPNYFSVIDVYFFQIEAAKYWKNPQIFWSFAKQKYVYSNKGDNISVSSTKDSFSTPDIWVRII